MLQRYREALRQKNYQEDAAQVAIIQEMQGIADALQARWQETPPSGWRAWFSKKEIKEIKGLYCYGDVGRGKTFLMDLFVDYMPETRKRRRHYHRFMLELHAALRELGQIENPIEAVVKRFAEEFELLCLDEFAVHDITDAMLLSRLFEAFTRHGIVLVTTSNVVPDDLYKNGLQRERFLPAIDWIKQHLQVHSVAAGEDYRRRHFQREHIVRLAQEEALQADLEALSGSALNSDLPFLYGSRSIPVVKRNEHAVMFDFRVLCEGNHSQKDYIELCKRFPYLALTHLPVLKEDKEDAAKRFLLLIDEAYDRRVKMLFSVAAPIETIYQGKRFRFEYQRLQSRLAEMQTDFYWQQAHLP